MKSNGVIQRRLALLDDYVLRLDAAYGEQDTGGVCRR